MIVTNVERDSRNRARLSRTPYATTPATLPPARIAFVPFSLDEVEVQPEDAIRAAAIRSRSSSACSCSYPSHTR